MKDLANNALRSPEFFPQAFDLREDIVTLLRLSRADYTAASFLDDRILGPSARLERIRWSDLEPAIHAAQLAESCGFLFHIGHVGSTLLARLIGDHAGAFVLREPAILRTFAQLRNVAAPGSMALPEDALERRLAGCLKLLSRTFDTQDRALIKTTSFVSEMAEELLSRPAAGPAIMVSVAPATYLATILGGENSRRENAALLPSRVQRLVRRSGIDAAAVANLREGEAIALSWACETSALAQAARGAGDRILQIDFDQFLASPEPLLLAALTHLRIPATPAQVASVLVGPLMRRYSKAPEFAYDTALRQSILDQARTLYDDQIHLGLAWLDRMARESDLLREALVFAGGCIDDG